jgi:hypothetical protein
MDVQRPVTEVGPEHAPFVGAAARIAVHSGAIGVTSQNVRAVRALMNRVVLAQSAIPGERIFVKAIRQLAQVKLPDVGWCRLHRYAMTSTPAAKQNAVTTRTSAIARQDGLQQIHDYRSNIPVGARPDGRSNLNAIHKVPDWLAGHFVLVT